MTSLAELLVDADRPAPRRRGRTAVLALSGVVTAGVLGVGAWTGTGWLHDADERAAAGTSTAAVEAVVRRVEAAPDGRGLAAALDTAADAAGVVDRAAARVRTRRGPSGAALTAELGSEHAVLAALTGLTGLRTGPLRTWGRARPVLDGALAAERTSREALVAQRPAVAARLAVLDRLAPALDAAAGRVLSRAAGVELGRTAASLEAVRTTADLRALAATAAAQQDALRATADVLADSTVQAAVIRCADVARALAGLVELSGEDASSWPPARDTLLAQVGTGPVEHVDAVVGRARSGVDDWRRARGSAAAARDADAAALGTYVEQVRALTGGLSALDRDLLLLLPPGSTGPSAAADPGAALRRQSLDAQAARRRDLARALDVLTPPAVVAGEHAALVRAVERSAALAEAAAAGRPVASTAPDSVVRQRTQAVQGWQHGAARAETLVATRPLPEPPAL